MTFDRFVLCPKCGEPKGVVVAITLTSAGRGPSRIHPAESPEVSSEVVPCEFCDYAPTDAEARLLTIAAETALLESGDIEEAVRDYHAGAEVDA